MKQNKLQFLRLEKTTFTSMRAVGAAYTKKVAELPFTLRRLYSPSGDNFRVCSSACHVSPLVGLCIYRKFCLWLREFVFTDWIRATRGDGEVCTVLAEAKRARGWFYLLQ